MARDTITIKFNIEANFETIQTIRQVLNHPQKQQSLTILLTAETRAALQAFGVDLFKLTPTVKVSRYRETKKGPRLPPPVLKDGRLTVWDYDFDQEIETIEVDRPDWCVWLEETSTQSFRYEVGVGSFTAIKENRRGRAVWYAHKRIRGQLKRFYLGKADSLSVKKLAETARKMARLVAGQSH